MSGYRLLIGDCRDVMASMDAASVQTCVTSPPYWGGVRDYGVAGQLGMDRQPADYVAGMVEVFRAVRRVLREDGSLWLNVGDVYAASGKGGGGNRGDRKSWSSIAGRTGFRTAPAGFKPKDLTLTPFMLADALRRDGWFLRQTVIWAKPSAVEPPRLDRPSLSHEYVYLLTPGRDSAVRHPGEAWFTRSVWEIAPEARVDHPATMPAELARRCIVSSSTPGDTVLDPFAGSGTTGMVATGNGRDAILCELNPEYATLIRERIGPLLEQAAA